MLEKQTLALSANVSSSSLLLVTVITTGVKLINCCILLIQNKCHNKINIIFNDQGKISKFVPQEVFDMSGCALAEGRVKLAQYYGFK